MIFYTDFCIWRFYHSIFSGVFTINQVELETIKDYSINNSKIMPYYDNNDKTRCHNQDQDTTKLRCQELF